MNFQKIVITIAVILLILSLAFIGTAINSEKKKHSVSSGNCRMS